MKISVKLSNVGAALRGLNRREIALRDAMSRSVQDGAQIVLRKVLVKLSGQVLTPRSGRLRSSFHTEFLPGPPPTGVVGTNVEYAAIHEFGGRTEPHVILPVKAKALRWASGFSLATALNIGGSNRGRGKFKRGKGGFEGFMFARRVNHPGSVIPPRPYLGPALRDSLPEIREVMLGRLARAVAPGTKIA